MLTVIIAILAVAASLLFVAKKMQKVPKVHTRTLVARCALLRPAAQQITETNKDKKLPPQVPAVLPYVGNAIRYTSHNHVLRHALIFAPPASAAAPCSITRTCTRRCGCPRCASA